MELAELDLNKIYSYADYFSWKFEERVELIKGKIFKMSPAPNRWHQEILSVLHVLIGIHLRGKSCRVFEAPFDVRFPKQSNNDKQIFTVLQPDLCVVCDLSKLDNKGCLGAPDLVVEVLSPGNNTKELKNKYNVYEEAGVREYWVVSPQDRTLNINELLDGRFVQSRTMVAGDVVTSKVLPGFSLDLSEVFEGMADAE